MKEKDLFAALEFIGAEFEPEDIWWHRPSPKFRSVMKVYHGAYFTIFAECRSGKGWTWKILDRGVQRNDLIWGRIFHTGDACLEGIWFDAKRNQVSVPHFYDTQGTRLQDMIYRITATMHWPCIAEPYMEVRVLHVEEDDEHYRGMAWLTDAVLIQMFYQMKKDPATASSIYPLFFDRLTDIEPALIEKIR